MSHEIHPTVEELDEAREHVEDALQKAERELDKEEDYTLSLGWTESPFTIEQMDGAAGHAHASDRVEVDFNMQPDNWVLAIKASSAHEFAHAWHYEQRGGRTDKVWEYVLDEAITQNFTEKIFPEYTTPWRTKHSVEDIAEYWPEIKENELDRDMQDVGHPYELYINKSEDGYPNWLGYSMSYRIGQQLLDDGHDLEDFPDLEKEDVVAAGNKLFG